MKYPALLIGVVALLISACSSGPRGGGYYQDDGPQDRSPADLAKVPDAVPRDEPLSSSGNKTYTALGVSYTPLKSANGYRERGVASWYGRKFHGKRTSNGESYDMYAMSAAHRTLPLPSYVRVRNLQNGRSVVVRVNDRGPFLHNRLIDLSYSAAYRLGMTGAGTAVVEVEAVGSNTPTTVTAQPSFNLVSTANAADAPPHLAVQVGAFQVQENANQLRQRLERAGFSSVQVETDATGTIYRVRIGPVATVEQGDRLVADVARAGINDALLVVD
ncbi:MAG: septal ring lytic transglycosylase RlpA family protein [Gammaproteobacteria bacterium]|nr:septal ring lytic transglycosylase RlpA family protein [Gammaproteobacteria bacterium]